MADDRYMIELAHKLDAIESAARAMLAALKAVKDDIAVVKMGGDNFDRCIKAKRQVRAAIAQAKAAGIKVTP